MASLSTRLIHLRKETGLNRTSFAEKIGIPSTTLRNYELGIREPGHSYILRMAKMFGTTTDYILGLSDERNGASTSRGVQQWSAPLINAYTSAIQPTQEAACAVLGISHVIPSNEPEEFAEEETESMLTFAYPSAAGIPLYVEGDFEQKEFPKSMIPSGADFAIRIDGDSMEPTIQDGSYVFIRKQPDLQNGQIGIFMIDDSAACKRFYKKGNAITLKSDNPTHKDIVVKDYETFYIVGKVLGYR